PRAASSLFPASPAQASARKGGRSRVPQCLPRSAGRSMPSIVILKAGESMTHDLARDETVIGGHPECHIQIDSNRVSRKHARVFRDGGRFLVEDLGSGNGTTVNGVRIVNPTPLTHDDRVKLGPILLRFIDQPGAQNRAPARGPGAGGDR